MSSLWTDLLFLHGHIRDHRLARRLAAAPATTPDRGNDPPPGEITHAKPRSWTARLCLGIGDGILRTQ